MADSVRPSAALEEKLSSLLSSPSFSVATYLNLALRDYDSDEEELQRRMAELALQLQLQTQACHEDIGRIGAELQAILPRCAADVGRVGVGLEGMKIDAAQLLEESALQSNDEVSCSLETLSTLHALRSNLAHTKDILKAAATWDTSLNSIPPLLAQQNLTEAVAALAQLESGERALRGMPSGREERQEAIQKTRQQVQVLLAPQLKHALQNMHTRLAPLQQCVSLYGALDKIDVLQQEYVQNRPGSVHKSWFSFSPSGGSNAPGGTEGLETFVSWLPGWYDAVLNLLTEERRQSLAVFGPDLAPEMTVRVLGECFRPILPSFKNRLQALYGSESNTSAGGGSLESICAIYDSTLQFLSLVFETVAGGWHDVADATSTPGSKVYQLVMSVFLEVASPFASYQEKIPLLEEKHCAIAQQLVAKDIRQAVNTSTNTISGLQDATERLKGLAPYVFPLAEAAMGRIELMTAGYRITESLSTVDKSLAAHAGELVIAIRSLSASTTADENNLAETFDDQHVSCALEVLKVAGIFQRSLIDFEGKSRERLSVLAERMVAFAAREKQLKESPSSFQLPDSVSVVEIDSILTKSLLAESGEGDSNAMILQRLGSTDSAAGTLYPESRDSVTRLSLSCHAFVFDVCSVVPRKHLAAMPSMMCWTEQADPDDFDSYGTLPQQYITSVGEHMLALVQALEPFSLDRESLKLANEVMAGVRSVALQPWRELLAAAGSQESVSEALMNGKELVGLVEVTNFDDEEDDNLTVDDQEDEGAKASAAFCNQWLDVVGLAVTGRLLERSVRIGKLTPKGCDHLAADLNYLVNVLAALGVAGHPHPLVNHVAVLVTMEHNELKRLIKGRDRSVPIVSALRSIEGRIGLMRGIAV